MRQIGYSESCVVGGGTGPWSLGTALCMIFTGAGLVVPGVLSFTKLAHGDVRYDITRTETTDVERAYVGGTPAMIYHQRETDYTVYANAPRCKCHSSIGLLMLWWGVGLLAGGFCALAGKN